MFMNMINWKVRFKNRFFWTALIPAVLLLIQQILAVFGIAFDPTSIGGQLVAIVGTVFGILSLFGIVNDPTTAGVVDSAQAMEYEEPKFSR